MKQVIVVRQDLRLPKGKMAAQVAHAAVQCTMKSDPSIRRKWMSTGMAKIVLKVKDLKELKQIQSAAESIGLETACITDAGKTVIEPGTITCLGIGPDDEAKIDRVTGHLGMI